MRAYLIPLAILLPLASGGCVTRTAWDMATMPVKVAKMPVRMGSQVVDWTTTSAAESDRNYGRKAKKRDAEEGRRRRDADRRCRHDPRACGRGGS